MPTNANTFNSRVTSEALETKFRQVFPSQGGAELPQDLFASGVIQPVVDFSSVAEGSVLTQNLQTAWDFSTDHDSVTGATTTIITNTGFWLVDFTIAALSTGSVQGSLYISDGLTNKLIFRLNAASGTEYFLERPMVIFLRAGDSFVCDANANTYMDVVHRQIADVNGNLVNPLGFTFS